MSQAYKITGTLYVTRCNDYVVAGCRQPGQQSSETNWVQEPGGQLENEVQEYAMSRAPEK